MRNSPFHLLIALSLAATVSLGQVNLDNVTGGCAPDGCSGNGVCVSGVCVCNALWSSNADFIIVEDCTLSIIAMYILWSITLFVCCLVIYKTAWVVAARFENFFAQRKANKNYSLSKNPGLLAVMSLYGIAVPCVAAMAIVHYVNPITRVAFDPLPTALFFTAKFGLWVGALFLQGPLLAVALKGEAMFDGLVKFNHRFNIFVNVLAIIIGGIPFVTLMHFQDNIPKQYEVIRAYYFGQALVLFMQFLESYLVKLRLNYVLKRAAGLISSDKTASILAKVNAAQGTIIKSAVSQCIINVLMGAVPYLLNKHAYFLPISWIAIPLIAKNVALQIELDKKGTKTMAQRFRNLIGATSQTSNNNDGTSPSSHMNMPPGMTSGKVTASEHTMVPSTLMETKNPVMSKAPASQIGSTDGMEEILSGESEEAKKKFADFCRAKYAGDSLNFYDAVVEYEKTDTKKLKAKGEAIMKRFVVDGASEAVDFPSDLRQDLLAVLASGSFVPSTFAATKKVAFELLKSNFYHKFTESLQGGA